jgi:hypothetical protein
MEAYVSVSKKKDNTEPNQHSIKPYAGKPRWTDQFVQPYRNSPGSTGTASWPRRPRRGRSPTNQGHHFCTSTARNRNGKAFLFRKAKQRQRAQSITGSD